MSCCLHASTHEHVFLGYYFYSQDELESYVFKSIFRCDAVNTEKLFPSLLLLVCQSADQKKPDIHFFNCETVKVSNNLSGSRPGPPRWSWVADLLSQFLRHQTNGDTCYRRRSRSVMTSHKRFQIPPRTGPRSCLRSSGRKNSLLYVLKQIN